MEKNEYKKIADEILEISLVLFFVEDALNTVDYLEKEMEDSMNRQSIAGGPFIRTAKSTMLKVALTELAKLFSAKAYNCDLQNLFFHLKDLTFYGHYNIRRSQVDHWEKRLTGQSQAIAFVLLRGRTIPLKISQQQYISEKLELSSVRNLLGVVTEIIIEINQSLFSTNFQERMPLNTIQIDARRVIEVLKEEARKDI